MNLSEIVLAVTAILIGWYSFETMRARREMKWQRVIQTRAALVQAKGAWYHLYARIAENDRAEMAPEARKSYNDAVHQMTTSAVDLAKLIKDLEEDMKRV
jgi:hypothetical protein